MGSQGICTADPQNPNRNPCSGQIQMLQRKDLRLDSVKLALEVLLAEKNRAQSTLPMGTPNYCSEIRSKRSITVCPLISVQESRNLLFFISFHLQLHIKTVDTSMRTCIQVSFVFWPLSQSKALKNRWVLIVSLDTLVFPFGGVRRSGSGGIETQLRSNSLP